MACEAPVTELIRLASFSKWPVEFAVMTTVSLVRLATAGFLYTGDADAIVCCYCNIVVSGWLGTRRSPLLEHRCALNSATHANEPVVHNIRVSDSRRYEETAASSGQDAVHDVRDSVTQRLEVDEVSRTPEVSSLSRHMALMDINTASESTSRNVRDAAPDGTNNDEQQLMEENRRLRDAKTCKVCMDNYVNTVFLPCGHLVSCDQCSPKLRNCPICRTYIRGTVKTIIS